jgi:transcriptional regulator with XRE-family HTH domain
MQYFRVNVSVTIAEFRKLFHELLEVAVGATDIDLERPGPTILYLTRRGDDIPYRLRAPAYRAEVPLWYTNAIFAKTPPDYPHQSRAVQMPAKAPSEIDQKVGVRITALRRAKGLSQAELGKVVGVTFQQIQKYEKGVNRVGAGRLQEIAKFLGVPVSVMFSDDTETAQEATGLALFSQPGAVDLLKAFTAIKNAQLRRDILAIARTAVRLSGGSSSKNSQNTAGDGLQSISEA